MRSITLCLDAWAVTQPEKLLFAFIDADGHEREAYTYRQFQMRTRGLADQLARSTGLARNDRVLLAYPPGLELIVAFFACARMGAIPVPTPAAMNNGRGLPKLLKWPKTEVERVSSDLERVEGGGDVFVLPDF